MPVFIFDFGSPHRFAPVGFRPVTQVQIRSGLRVALISACLALATLLGDIRTASAACSPTLNPNDSGITATCSGADQTTTYGDGSQDVSSVTVNSGATVAVSGSSGVVRSFRFNSGEVINSGSIAATNSSGAAFAIFNSVGTVTNSGSVIATTNNSGSAYAIQGDAFAVNNSGSIIATANSSGAAYAIQSLVGDTPVTNSGSIVATANSGWAAYAYQDSLGNARVTNSGSITATNSFGLAVAIQEDMGTTTVTNSGSITARSGARSAYAIRTDFGTTTVTNSGSITATSNGAGDAFAIYASGSSALLNTGIISASTVSGSPYAVYFSSGGNSVTLGAGSKLIGSLQIGSTGGNSLSFIGGNSNLTFQTGDLTSASLTGSTIPYAVSCDRAAALDPTSFAANTTMIQSVTRVISSLAPDFVMAQKDGKPFPVVSYAQEAVALKLPEGAMAYVADAPLKGQTAVTADGTSIWSRFFGGQSYDKAVGTLLGFRNTYYGGAIGFDRPVDANLRYGAFLGGLSGTSKLALNYGDTDSQMGFVGVYARYVSDASFVKVGLQTGYGNNSSKRRTNNNLLASGVETANSNSKTWYVSPELSVGHVFALGHFLNGDVSLTPTGQVRFLYGAFGSYTETGGTDNLSIGSRTAQSVEERLTTKFSHVSAFLSDYQLKLDLIGGVLGTQRVSGGTVTGSLLGQSIRFSEPGKASRKAATVGLGAEVTKGLTSVFMAGECIFQPNGVAEYTGRVGVGFRF